MTISMLLRVLPKPVVIDFATFTSPTAGGIPPIKPVNNAAMMRAEKAWIFVFNYEENQDGDTDNEAQYHLNSRNAVH